MSELPRYQCHKIVHALKIKTAQVSGSTSSPDTKYFLLPEGERFSKIEVSKEWWKKHQPYSVENNGGYFVVYEDGYQSFSPAEAFESGYTRI